MSDNYQAIIVGGQVAGLLVGLLLAKQGLKVLIADNGEASGGYIRKGLWYPHEPAWPAMGNLPKELDDILAAAEGREAEHGKAPVADKRALFQVVWCDERLEVYPFGTPYNNDLQRVFGGQKDSIDSWHKAIDQDAGRLLGLLAQAPYHFFPESLWGRFKFKYWRKRAEAYLVPPWQEMVKAVPPRWYEFVEDISGYFFNQVTSDKANQLGMGLALAGLFSLRPAAGYHDGSLSETLKDLFVKQGGQWTSAAVTALQQRKGKVVGLVLEGQEVSAPLFVLSSYCRYIQPWLSSSKKTGIFLEQLEVMPPCEVIWTEHVLAKAEALPEGMCQRLFLQVDPQASKLLNKFLWVEWRHPHGPSEAGARQPVKIDDRHVLFSISGRVPWRAIQRPDQAALIRDAFFNNLAAIVPFLEEHLEDRASALESTGWDEKSVAPRLPPQWHYPRYEGGPMLAVLPYLTPFDNLYRCGADNLPMMGLLGQFFTARSVAQSIIARLQKQ